MREKNLDLMRPDGVVGVLKNSSLAFVRELVGADPVAVFRWAILRAFFRAHFAFQEAGRAHRHGRGTVFSLMIWNILLFIFKFYMLIIWRYFLFILADGTKTSIQNRYRTPNENLIRYHNFHV